MDTTVMRQIERADPGAFRTPGAVRVLLLEDDPNDAEQIVRELRKLERTVIPLRVETRQDFERALEEFGPDIVLLEYQLPTFDGASALKLVRARHPEIPAVLVTGALGDEMAIALLKSGFKDFVLKGNLVRLVPAVEHALADEQAIRVRKAAEKAVRLSALRYRRLFEAANDGIVILDGETGAIVDVNPFVTQRLGCNREELLGKMLWEIGLFEDQGTSKKALAELRTRGYVRHDDIKLRCKDGTSLAVEFVGSTYDVGGRRISQCNLRDISDRRSIQQALSESELRFRSLIENTSDVIGIVRADGTIGYVSPAIREVAGYEPADVIGRAFLEMIHPDDREPARCALSALSASPGNRAQITLRLLHRNGTVRKTETLAQNLLDAPGINGIVLSTRDLSERERANEALRAAERKYGDLFDATGDAILTLDPDSGGIVSANRAAITLFGAKDEAELLSRKPWALSPERQPDGTKSTEKAAEILGAAMRKGSHLFEWMHRQAGGAEFPADVLLTRVVTNGRVSLYATIRDISERKRADQQLALNAAVSAAIQQESPDGILLVDPREGIVSYNQRFAHIMSVPPGMLGAGVDEPVLQAVLAVVADPPAFLAGVKALYADPEARAKDEIRLKDGCVLERITGPVKLGDGTYVGRVWFFRDITERIRTQEQLQAAHERLARVNRALRTLSACNSAVVHATTEVQLLQDMCRTVVEVGGYKTAWVGFAERDPEKSVRPVAWAGTGEQYARHLDISWADAERGRGPTGRCIRSAVPQLARDIEADPSMAPWRASARERGYLSSLALPLTGSAGVFGALTIYAGERDAFDADELQLLSEMAGDFSYGITALRTVTAHAEGLHRLELSMEGTVRALAGTVETRDPYTAGHQRRVAVLAVAIAREMSLAEHAVRGLELAATVHDIGKINVPAEILAKPGKVSSTELELIKTHAESGYEILKDVEFPWPVAEMVRQHHERLDGSGYPRGLKSDQILKEAKILAVADVVEAMSSHRPYRPSKGIEAALEEIARIRGTQLDAHAVDACLKLFRERGFEFSPEARRKGTPPSHWN